MTGREHQDVAGAACDPDLALGVDLLERQGMRPLLLADLVGRSEP